MVSLRERKARPSYSNIPEGLSDLSDSIEDEAGKGTGSGAGSGSGSPAGGLNDEELLSSGGSSGFRPDDGEEEGSNDREQGGEEEVTDDEDEEMDQVDEEEESKLEPLTPQEQRSFPAPPASSRNDEPVNQKGPNRPPASLGPRKHNISSFVGPEVLKLPAPYRNLIKQSATRLAVPPLATAHAQKIASNRKEKSRVQGSIVYPDGPVTPFGVRLTAPPSRRERAEVEVVEEPEEAGERSEKRRRRAYQVGRFVPLLSPWEVWEGEGWWPEMWEGVSGSSMGVGTGNGKGKGKGKGRTGWKMRDEVRIRLEEVGRMRVDEVELLSEA